MGCFEDGTCSGLHNGLTTCEGCPMELAARAMLEVLGPNTIVITPPSCSAILTGYGRQTGWKIPSFQSNLEAVAAYASGMSEGLKMLGKDGINVVGFAGDGGTVDIGLQALSGAIERGHRFIYICYDNEAYMNTGIQRSGATPYMARTKTTPAGKGEKAKDIDTMLLMQGLAYQATASVGYIDDFKSKVKKASQCGGPSFIHVHTPCATGWRFLPKDTISISRLAVKSGLWLLWENGYEGFRVNIKPSDFEAAREYTMMQGRFKGLSGEETDTIIASAKNKYAELLELGKLFSGISGQE